MKINIYDKSELISLMKMIRGETSVGITSGCFDLLHPLHIHYLERCAM
jgi:bifunctional ADP-heptose synthase (sugar kinase/adenylyltransferase)